MFEIARRLLPFPVVEEVNPGAIRIELPETYKLVHDVFSVHDIRPWLSHESHVLAPTYPEVQPHPAFNPVVQIVDRRAANSRLPRNTRPIDISAVYKALRASGAAEWLRTDAFVTSAEQELVLSFEKCCPRSDNLPCAPVAHYQAGDSGYESPEEVDLGLRSDLRKHFEFDS